MKNIYSFIIFMLVCLPLFAETDPFFARNMEKRSLTAFTDFIVPDNDPLDVVAYHLELKLEPNTKTVHGHVEILLTAFSELHTVNLDLYALTADSVLTGNVPLNFSQQDGIVSIPLDKSITQTDSVTLSLWYHGSPIAEPGANSWGGFYFYGDGNAFTLGAGLNSENVSMTRTWLPCHDVPWDKARFDMTFNVPAGKYVASNGLLVSTEEHFTETDSTVSFRWVENHPTATYLVSLAMNDYCVIRSVVNDTLPIEIYTTKSDSAKVAVQFENVADMVRIYSEKFAPYMFDKVGYAMTPEGAMEHQTCISFPDYVITPTHTYDYLIAHELAHHWWGDWVTVRDWRDIWLNEGFATYSEVIFLENFKGIEAGLAHVKKHMSGYLIGESAEGTLPIYDHPVMWGVHTYEKGGCVLHMLRTVVGDSLFFTILQEYGNRYAFSNVSTPDFIQVVNEVTGDHMDWFFNQWIYSAGYPLYEYSWNCTPLENSQYVFNAVISQSSGDPTMFNLPLEVKLVYNGGDTTLNVQMDGSARFIQAILPANVTLIRLDPEEKLLNKDKNIPYYPLQIQNMTIYDAETGDGDGNPEPGESFGLSLAVLGMSNMNNVVMELTAIDDFVHITQNRVELNQVIYGQVSETNQFELSVDSIVGPRTINLTVQFYMNSLPVYQTVLQMDLLTPQVLFVEGFESILGRWETNKLWGTNFWAHSGANCMTDSPNGYYENNSENYLTLTRPIDLTKVSTACLEFYHVHLLGSGDTCLVQVSDDGELWQNAAAYTGTVDNWQQEIVNLDAWCGAGKSPVQIRFNVKADGSDVYDGWYIDDMTIFADTLITRVPGGHKPAIPVRHSLQANYPNPFNPETVIAFELPQYERACIDIFNSLGQKIITLTDRQYNAGMHQIVWDGHNSMGLQTPSGIYFYRITTPSFQDIKKMLLLR